MVLAASTSCLTDVPFPQIGKQVTIEYFGESTSDARDKKGGGVSLRFPRIKHIWEGEKRDV